MKDSFSPEDVEVIKKYFSEYQELEENKKQLRTETSALKKNLAGFLECKVTDAGKLLKKMLAKYNGDDSEREVDAVFESLFESPSSEDEETEVSEE